MKLKFKDLGNNLTLYHIIIFFNKREYLPPQVSYKEFPYLFFVKLSYNRSFLLKVISIGGGEMIAKSRYVFMLCLKCIRGFKKILKSRKTHL